MFVLISYSGSLPYNFQPFLTTHISGVHTLALFCYIVINLKVIKNQFIVLQMTTTVLVVALLATVQFDGILADVQVGSKIVRTLIAILIAISPKNLFSWLLIYVELRQREHS